MTPRRLAAAALLISACTASSRSEDARDLSVVIQIDDTGVTVVGTAPRDPAVVAVPADDSPQLEFELRDGGDQLIASGLFPEPRRVRAEWFEGFSLRRTDIATAFGTAEITLPLEHGIL